MLMAKALKCLRCGWEWTSRLSKTKPKTCPGCKSPQWNKAKGKT